MTVKMAFQALGLHGNVVEGVRYAGEEVSVVVQLDNEELDRRERHGLHAVTDPNLLDILTTLPLGHAIPWPSIDPVAAAFLDAGPKGVIRSTSESVERMVKPPLRVLCIASIDDKPWRRSLMSVSVFAPDAPRIIVLQRLPHRHDELMSLARRLGVGVVALEPQVNVWAEPGRRHLRRNGGRHWLLLETVFSRWLEGDLLRQARPR